MSDICNFKAFVGYLISLIKKIIDIIIAKQQEPKINLAKKSHLNKEQKLLTY